MRYAVVSDVHANLEALTVVLARIDCMPVDRVVCLGDLVGYYSNPNEVVETVRRRRLACVAGNHDRMAAGAKEPTHCTERARRALYWTREKLTADNRSYFHRTIPS